MKSGHVFLSLLACLAVALVMGCQSPIRPETQPPGRELSPRARVDQLIDDLYAAFCFDAHGSFDAAFLERASARGATFVAPVQKGRPPVGVDTATFLADFEAYIDGSPLEETGYYERVIHRRVEVFGAIAHAWVTFEGFVPGEEPDRRGVDSLQFALEGDDWKLVSFTTQYESESLPLPRRFLPTQRASGPSTLRRSPSQWPAMPRRSRATLR